jgi:predicted nucleic acid-binding protein
VKAPIANLADFAALDPFFRIIEQGLAALYPDAVVPKGGWRWIESAQYRLLRHGAHRALSAVDLLICATAVHHDLIVLHDDSDFVTAARHLPDLRERIIHDTPQAD